MILDLADLPTWRAHVWLALTRLGLRVEASAPGALAIRPPGYRRSLVLPISGQSRPDEAPEARAASLMREKIAPEFPRALVVSGFRERAGCGQWRTVGRDHVLCDGKTAGRCGSFPACAACLQDARKREGLTRC